MNGKKTYLVALGMIALALVNYATGHDVQVDWKFILEALGISALRNGVAKVQAGQQP